MRKSTNIIGRQPVVEALRDGQQLERIFIQKNIGGEIIDEIRSLAQKLQIPINVVPVEKLNYITRANHQGVIAINSIIQYHELQDVI
ncbi:MAG: RNA methyltransferase substrate-binding domain-containing protein, partial [Bacteroidota bacterium]